MSESAPRTRRTRHRENNDAAAVSSTSERRIRFKEPEDGAGATAHNDQSSSAVDGHSASRRRRIRSEEKTATATQESPAEDSAVRTRSRRLRQSAPPSAETPVTTETATESPAPAEETGRRRRHRASAGPASSGDVVDAVPVSTDAAAVAAASFATLNGSTADSSATGRRRRHISRESSDELLDTTGSSTQPVEVNESPRSRRLPLENSRATDNDTHQRTTDGRSSVEMAGSSRDSGRSGDGSLSRENSSDSAGGSAEVTGQREKKRGLGGLSPEKKKLLKKLIMERAMQELQREEEEKKMAKLNYLQEHVEPLECDGLDHDALVALAKNIHNKISHLEEEKYDWEVKLRKQDYEINNLTIQVNDIKGKFVKPVLRKVSKADAKLAKFVGK